MTKHLHPSTRETSGTAETAVSISGRARAAGLLAAAVLGLGGCTTPDASDIYAKTGIIRGTVFYPGGRARGNVYVFLYSAANLPPPEGTGRPVNFIALDRRRLFGDALDGVASDFTAEFVMPTVPAGRYQLRAFLDADGDFNPVYDLLGQATAGDVGGGYVDLETQAFKTIEVAEGEAVSGVLVTLARTFPVERPAFEIAGATEFSTPYASPQSFVLQSKIVNREQVRMDPLYSKFLIQFVDLDRDGVPDDTNGDHLPDVYPQVLLRLIGSTDGTVVVPAITNPSPFLDRLRAVGTATASRLELILPPAAVRIGADGARQILPAPPVGEYETVVISGTGQVWTVPNNLDTIQPSATDPSQSVKVRMSAATSVPPGSIAGTVSIHADAPADTYVFAFAEASPPPPEGTGRPVAAASVPRAAFVTGAGPNGPKHDAPFVLRGLPERGDGSAGRYLLRAIADRDRNFVPVIPLLQQATAGDLVGGAAAAVDVTGAVAGVEVVLKDALPFERPGFRLTGRTRFPRTGAPARLTLEAHAVTALAMHPDKTIFPIALSARDQDGDNFKDLAPQVLLTKMVDGGAPGTAANDPEAIVVPGVVDLIPHTAKLAGGVPVVPSPRLDVILPPLAVKLAPDGSRTVVSPIPPGRYRVNVISPFGQTWSVPNETDALYARLGGPLADPTQAEFVEFESNAIPGGVITGRLNVPAPLPTGDYQLVVLAFPESAPPPPLGTGRPVASALVSKAAFEVDPFYRLAGLPTGRYTVRAFLDADDDFTAWYDTMNQPDRGDRGGGHVDARGAFAPVLVDALGAPVQNADVVIPTATTLPFDRPVFSMPSEARLSLSGAPVPLTLRTENAATDLLTAGGVFPVQWGDLDGDGTADDTNGDTVPDLVFPRFVAELLDPNDPTHLKTAGSPVVIPGIVDPRQVVGFPSDDPTALTAIVPVSELVVVFPPVGIDLRTGQRVTPPTGRYRVTAITGLGQTWTVPNELSLAGDGLAPAQARWLSVAE